MMQGTQYQRAVDPTGAVAMSLERAVSMVGPVQRPSLGWRVANWARYRWRELPALGVYRFLGWAFGLVWMESCLRLTLTRGDGSIVDFGVVSRRVVTTAGVNYLVDAFQGTVEPENMKYHGFGIGTTAENASQTALVTELTTEYVTNSTRPTGTTTEGASANIYRTVATLAPDSGGTLAITEHGVFSADAAGTLLDRSVFSAINLVAGSDSLAATYELTLSSGG